MTEVQVIFNLTKLIMVPVCALCSIGEILKHNNIKKYKTQLRPLVEFRSPTKGLILLQAK